MTDQIKSISTHRLTVPIATVGAIVSCVLGLVFYMQQGFDDVQARIVPMSEDIAVIKEQVANQNKSVETYRGQNVALMREVTDLWMHVAGIEAKK